MECEVGDYAHVNYFPKDLVESHAEIQVRAPDAPCVLFNVTKLDPIATHAKNWVFRPVQHIICGVEHLAYKRIQ